MCVCVGERERGRENNYQRRREEVLEREHFRERIRRSPGITRAAAGICATSLLKCLS